MIVNEIARIKSLFERRFDNIILVTYRKNFRPLLTEDICIMEYVDRTYANPEKLKQIRTTTDANWGCTIR
jgi:hypothetical protein